MNTITGNEPSRADLIQICKDAVVHHTKWQDRDSFIAQKGIQSIYRGLTAGLDYKMVIEGDDTIWLEFIQPIDFERLKEEGKHLEISSREDYWKDCDPDMEGEMFDGDGIDFYSNWTQTFMPTRERLNKVGVGDDWY